MQIEPYRWRLSPGFVAHLWKAVTQQHHRELAPLIRALVPSDAVVFDVGAHAGQFAKLFAATAPAGRIYAFEPGSYARAILRCALAAKRASNVTVVPLGLGAAAGLAVLSVPVKASGSSGFGLSNFGAPERRWARVSQELVGRASVDEVVEALDLSRLDFIKADIEGWEVQLLRGATTSLRRFRPRLLLELTGEHLGRAGDTLEDAFGLLEEFGYRGFALAADGSLRSLELPIDGDAWFLPEEDPLTTGDLLSEPVIRP